LLLQRERTITECLERVGFGGPSDEVEQLLSVSEAIVLLQRHERARQARNRALHIKAQAYATVIQHISFEFHKFTPFSIALYTIFITIYEHKTFSAYSKNVFPYS